MRTDDLLAPTHIMNEFYTWLWWMTEESGGTMPGGGDLFVSEHLAFRAPEETRLVAIFNGHEPAGKDAKTALIQGKRLEEIRLVMRMDDRESVFTLKGSTCDVTGAKLSFPHEEEDVAGAFLRVEELMVLDTYLAKLFTHFAAVRASQDWEETRAQIVRWAEEGRQ